MSDITVKKGDTRDWVFTISDASNTAFDLTSATVQFRLKQSEDDSNSFFVRNTDGTGSDFISIGSPASGGQVTITPTTSDWASVSDGWEGVYVGEFAITDSNGRLNYTKDVTVNIEEALI